MGNSGRKEKKSLLRTWDRGGGPLSIRATFKHRELQNNDLDQSISMCYSGLIKVQI